MSSNRKSLLGGAVLAAVLAAPAPTFADDGKGKTVPAAVPVLLPDLVLEGPQYSTDPVFTQVSYTVRNVGGKDATRATVLRALCITDSGTEPRCGVGTGWYLGVAEMMHTYEIPVPPLHKGESVTLPLFYFGTHGTYRVSGIVTVDPGNLVPESNEANNRSTFSHSSGPVTVNMNAVGVPPGATPTPTHAYGTVGSASAPVGGTNVSLIKPTPTPIPLLTLSVDPAYDTGRQVYLIARNNTTTPLGAGTATLGCQLTSGGSCSVMGDIPFAVPPLAPGQWQTLGTFEVAAPEGPYTLTIATVGVASKPLVIVRP